MLNMERKSRLTSTSTFQRQLQAKNFFQQYLSCHTLNILVLYTDLVVHRLQASATRVLFWVKSPSHPQPHIKLLVTTQSYILL